MDQCIGEKVGNSSYFNFIATFDVHKSILDKYCIKQKFLQILFIKTVVL